MEKKTYILKLAPSALTGDASKPESVRRLFNNIAGLANETAPLDKVLALAEHLAKGGTVAAEPITVKDTFFEGDMEYWRICTPKQFEGLVLPYNHLLPCDWEPVDHIVIKNEGIEDDE